MLAWQADAKKNKGFRRSGYNYKELVREFSMCTDHGAFYVWLFYQFFLCNLFSFCLWFVCDSLEECISTYRVSAKLVSSGKSGKNGGKWGLLKNIWGKSGNLANAWNN